MKSTLPFQGFYESCHDAAMDDVLLSMFEDEKEFNAAFNKINWSQVHVSYAKEYAEQFFHTFKLKGEFQQLWSPREYNFDTDKIVVEIHTDEVVRIHNNVLIYGESAWRKMCEEELKPRSGFMPFYSQNPDDWGSTEGWSEPQVALLLRAFVEITTSEEWGSDKEQDLMESARGNGRFEGWISSAMEVGHGSQ